MGYTVGHEVGDKVKDKWGTKQETMGRQFGRQAGHMAKTNGKHSGRQVRDKVPKLLEPCVQVGKEGEVVIRVPPLASRSSRLEIETQQFSAVGNFHAIITCCQSLPPAADSAANPSCASVASDPSKKPLPIPRKRT